MEKGSGEWEGQVGLESWKWASVKGVVGSWKLEVGSEVIASRQLAGRELAGREADLNKR